MSVIRPVLRSARLQKLNERCPQNMLLRSINSVEEQPHIRRCLHSTTQIVDNETPLTSMLPSTKSRQNSNGSMSHSPSTSHSRELEGIFSNRYDIRRTPEPPSASSETQRSPLRLSESIRMHLPQLLAQPPFYATIHIHGKPYLVTPGDTVRLPFLMHGVVPGDVLRLNRATTIGSREFTLRAGASVESANKEAEQLAENVPAEMIAGNTEGLSQTPYPRSSTAEAGKEVDLKRKGPPAYLDDRLFICRATIMGTESEPMRVKEVTKRRQRHIKHIKSKHKYTIIRINEVIPMALEDIE